MKKNFIIFSLALCAVVLGSCHKDQDNTSNTENASPTDRAADDPYAAEVQSNNDSLNVSKTKQDSSSTPEKINQGTDSYSEKATSTSSSNGSTLDKNNNRSGSKSKDSVTSVAGEQGAGSGVGNGGSINEAQHAPKKKIK